MSKALEILKQLHAMEISDLQKLGIDRVYIYETIAELEEQEDKTCNKCKFQNVDIDRCDFCKRYYSDQYEPKRK